MEQPKCTNCQQPLEMTQEGSYQINWKWNPKTNQYVRSRDFYCDVVDFPRCAHCGCEAYHQSLHIPKKDGIFVEYSKKN